MINNELIEAGNEYEKLLKIQEEQDFKKGWVFYRMKEKYGQEIADYYCNNSKDYENRYGFISDDRPDISD